jgi:hypothetical protein
MIAIIRGAGDARGAAAAPSSDAGRAHPGFDPYRPLRDELLGLPASGWIARCNRLAEERDLRSATGAPIRFVSGSEAQGALGYEAVIFNEGQVACRSQGRGANHDLHNALVWLTFPAVKATLNRLHVESASGRARAPDGDERGGDRMQRRNSGRGRLRDMATLLDESGLLWLSSAAGLDAQLLARDWRGLLVSSRGQVAVHVRPIVIGHGLLEKLAAPYKSMTAHCVICRRQERPEAVAAPAGKASQSVDESAAACIAAAFAAGRAPKLAPLPILGLPGWDPANLDPSYYEDARVFREPAWRPLDVARLHSR